jgi:glycosyltransferase involved in cell wall biosynthesis
VDERDAEGVYRWMNELAENWPLAVDLGRQAAETISQEFDSETQIRKLESTYLELIR